MKRTIQNQFPSYDGEVPVLEGWEDVSWHNDVCPSLGRQFGGVDARLFVDFVDPSRRELGGPRFRLVMGWGEIEMGIFAHFEGETLDELKAAAEAKFRGFHWHKLEGQLNDGQLLDWIVALAADDDQYQKGEE